MRDTGIQVEAKDNQLKGRLFYEAFFPPKSEMLTVPEDYEYGPPAWSFKNITNSQIHRAIDHMLPYKATAPGTIPNCVLKEAADLLVPWLGSLFRATFNLEYYPESWARTATIVLKKPGKADYTTPNAWRPISLSDAYARLLNACIVEDMSNRCEALGLLPKCQFGARPGRATTDAVHLLVATVKEAWRKNLLVVSALFLDVKGAFPSVDIDVLLHELKRKGVPQEYVGWIKRRMEHRRT